MHRKSDVPLLPEKFPNKLLLACIHFYATKLTYLLHVDYLHLTKRFGIVAASQLPLHYLLALKSWSPVQYLTRLSHEELNPYHRLLGRILISFFAIHASLYLNFYIQSGLLSKRIRDKDVILGISANMSFIIIGSTALATIRNYSYRLFFIIHVFLSIIVLPILYFHVSHLRVYILESAAIYILFIVQRNISSTPVQATLTRLPKTNLLSISIPLAPGLAKRLYTPGQHIYLSIPASLASPLNKLRLNPFTVAGIPSQEHKLRLVMRPLAGTTQILSNIAESSKKVSTSLVIEGPYGAAPYFPDLLENYDRILLVAGGVGATFTLPIYRHLLQRLRRTDASAGKVRFVWSVRDIADAAWGMQQLADDGETDPPGCEVYVSGSTRKQQQQLREEGHGEAASSVELEEHAQLLGEEAEQPVGSGEDKPASHYDATPYRRRGRPPLRVVVDKTFGYNASDRVAVLVCGPTGLGSALRVEVGRWVEKGRKVFWHGEEFGW